MNVPDDAEVSSSLARAHRSLDEAAPLLEHLRALLQGAQEAVGEAAAMTDKDPHDRRD